jgi:hypothetical protein
MSLPRLSWWSTALLIAACGCASKVTEHKSSETEPSAPTVTPPALTTSGPTTTTTTTSLSTPSQVQPIAGEFQQSVTRGEVDLARVSPAFLKVIAEPGILPSDIERGYDEAAAKKWFQTAANLKFDTPQYVNDFGDVGLVLGTIDGGAGGRYVLRLAKVKGLWKVEWFQRLPANSAPVDLADIGPRLAAECAVSAIVAAKDDASSRYAAATLTPEFRRKLGPPFNSDAARGYNLGGLRISIHSLTEGAKSYTLTPIGNDTYQAELTGGRKTRKITLKVAKGLAPGEWLVSDIQAD